MDQHQVQQLFHSRGCPHCLGTGYHGRIGLFECFWTDEVTQQMISEQTPEIALREHASKNHTSLLTDGLKKVALGITSLDEVMNATIGDISP